MVMKTHYENGKCYLTLALKTGHEIKFVFICKYVTRYIFKIEEIYQNVNISNSNDLKSSSQPLNH